MSQPVEIDPRGHRFNAVLTSVVIAAAIVALGVAPALAIALTAFQLAVFAIGGFHRLTASPYALAYARAVRPRIGPPRQLEDAAGPVFSQVLGTFFLAAGLAALVTGATTVGYIALALALFAALLNASIGLCLGCELHLILQRLRTPKA
ncbi:MAG TPA: DUF4395 domain-containing protein [Aeromicrobium sp.]|jgi:small-conductance mechanosensitive channel|nr:DUF4395 domain-containing protein [Aeromicrobium sp.]HKY56566.1 DUF4395 domain-containing protein [Aeromicrobium sp.]